MPRPLQLPKVYPITDVAITGLPHDEQLKRLADGGATFVQLREKKQASGAFYSQACAAVEMARKRGVTVLVNDRADIAAVTGADGVHLGQDDLPPDVARKLLGNQAIIGFSTHTVPQAVRARSFDIDYLAIGPIFETSTKSDPDPTLGLDGLRAVRQAIGEFPLVAIGGITPENAAAVLACGADSVAIISGLLSDPDGITGRIRHVLHSLASQ